MAQDEIIEYPIDKNGSLVTRRSGLSRMKPRLDAPPPNQPGSVDWTVKRMFGSPDQGIRYIESLVAGQGENADEKWVRFILLYKQWQIQHSRGELLEAPTLNQVCHALNFDTRDFLSELQGALRFVFTKMGSLQASLAIPDIVDKVIEVAKSDEGDRADRELALKLGGMLDERNGLSIQINNNNNNVMLKSEKEKMKSPLLQFSDTVIDIDDEARKEHEQNNDS